MTLKGHSFDYHLMNILVKAAFLNDASLKNSGPEDILRGDQLVFATENKEIRGMVLEVNRSLFNYAQYSKEL